MNLVFFPQYIDVLCICLICQFVGGQYLTAIFKLHNLRKAIELLYKMEWRNIHIKYDPYSIKNCSQPLSRT